MMKKFQSIIAIVLVCFATIAKAESPVWTVNSSDFEFSMTVTATITIDGEPFGASNDKVGVFVDDECRGVAVSSFVESFGKYFFFITIFSNSHSGDSLQFRYYNASLDQEYELINAEIFADGKNLGTPSQPYSLSNTVQTSANLNANDMDFSVYPNPTNTVANVNLALNADYNLMVYNCIGALVYQNVALRGNHTFNVSNLAKGIYVVKVTTGDMSFSKKMIIR